MYIFINNDLRMKPGRICAQVGHIVQKMTEELVRTGYEKYPPPEVYRRYMTWRDDCTKIVLRANAEQIHQLLHMDEARHFIDHDEITVVAFMPGSKIEETAKSYKLL